jgi:hypothetical protein
LPKLGNKTSSNAAQNDLKRMLVIGLNESKNF